LSAQSISEIMAELQADGHVAAIGSGTSSGGRRPLLYDLRQDSLRAVGVVVGSDQIAAVITDLSGEVYTEVTAPSALSDGPTAFVAALAWVLDEVLADQDHSRFAGIGLGLPRTIHRREAGVVRLADSPLWRDGVDLPAALQRYQLPIAAENRAHAVAVGEHLFGSARGSDDLLCLMIDQGLGGAVIAGGRLFAGGDGGAGAVGRMRLDTPDGAADPASVSDQVSRSGIVTTAQEKLRRARRRTLAGIRLSEIDAELVIDQALAGEPVMVEVLADVGRRLGAVVAASLCVTDSQLVLLCGSTTRAGALIIDPLMRELRHRWPFNLPEVRLGRLGRRAAVLGAAALVLTDKVGTIERDYAQ
jgi:predicted NBD/HSP70 family sugar kinase